MDVKDVDEFLMSKILRKITYWGIKHLSLVGRRLIVSHVLASSLGFFVSVWVGTWKVIRHIRAMLRDYIWGGQLRHVRARGTWSDCCVTLKKRRPKPH